MLKGVIGVLVFLLIFIAIIVAVVISFMYKGIRNMKEAQEQFIKTGGKKFNRSEYIRYQREQKEKNPFDKDYFKSSSKKQEEPKAQQETTTRRTTTSSGVTIIDDRESDEKKKIFDNNDGEYVEYEEV
jgi:predicted Holliday junction resolvase-like endonuclease